MTFENIILINANEESEGILVEPRPNAMSAFVGNAVEFYNKKVVDLY